MLAEETDEKRKARLEKMVVATTQLRLAWRQRKKEERRARLENDTATTRLMLAEETDEKRKARLEKMVVTTTQLRLAWRQRKKEERRAKKEIFF